MFPGVSTERPDVFSKMSKKEVYVFIDSHYVYKIIKKFKELYGKKYTIEYNQFYFSNIS